LEVETHTRFIDEGCGMDFLQYIKGKEEQAAPVREGLLLSSLAILRAAEKLL
jgi:hypothetical protein